MKQQAYDMIKSKHDSSGGKCGIYIPEILNALKTDYQTLKPFLSELSVEKKIRVRKGINGLLLFLM